MKIGIIGASGKAGSRIATEALCRRHEVTAIVRDRSKITNPALKVLERDLTGPVLLGCLGLLILGAAWGCGLGICHRKEKKK